VRILSISDHEDVRLSRELLLKSAGYDVVSTTSDSALMGEMPDVEIVIIGHSVPGRPASRLISAFRQAQSNAAIMRVTAQSLRAEDDCDASCFLEDGPAVFLRCLAGLIDRHRTS
jgi:DNA-binding NarL/FixJ family response regulator